MTTAEMPITDADKRFVLGPPRGFTPTSESITDTAHLFRCVRACVVGYKKSPTIEC